MVLSNHRLLLSLIDGLKQQTRQQLRSDIKAVLYSAWPTGSPPKLLMSSAALLLNRKGFPWSRNPIPHLIYYALSKHSPPIPQV